MGNRREAPGTDYTNVTFEEIKETLLQRAKSQYPDTYKDFSKSSFGSLMFDLVSMVGEQLNFYAQFVGNEGFVDWARSSLGLNSLANERDMSLSDSNSTTEMAFIVGIPASSVDNTSEDTVATFELLAETVLSGPGGQTAQLTQDLKFQPGVDIPVSTTYSSDGSRSLIYQYKKYAPVVIGEIKSLVVKVDTYAHFLKIKIPDLSCTEIISCYDAEGRRFYETPNLLVDTVLVPLRYQDADSGEAVVREVNYPAPRRFSVEEAPSGQKSLIFGYGSEETLDKSLNHPVHPINQSFKRRARNNTEDRIFLPNKYFASGKYGVPPKNTNLTIKYRLNTSSNSNLPVGSIDRVLEPLTVFLNDERMSPTKKEFIINSISCTNEEPANGLVKWRSTKEIAMTIKAASGAQGRAVTAKDMEAMCYKMPPRLGKIRKAAIFRDTVGLRKNLNIYVVSEDTDQNLQKANKILKQNLRTHLNSVKMMTDSIDIFDAEILNIGLYLDIVLHERENKNTAMSTIREFLFDQFTMTTPEIGQPFSKGEIERLLNLMPMIKRVNRIQVRTKNGTGYSSTTYDIAPNTTNDGQVLMPENFVWELKNPTDIIGTIL